MKLSIVTINYNNAEGLRKTLASVVEQTYPDIEHIIIDGGSTDGSVDVIKEYVQRVEKSFESNRDKNSEDRRVNSVVWESEKDRGIYDAMNKGIKKATGDYIQILNSGDLLAGPEVTARMIAALNNRNIGILYGNMIRDFGNYKTNRDSCLGKRVRELESEKVREVEWTMDDFIKGTVNHDPTYIRADLYERYGLYDDSLKIVSDWKWFVKAVVLGGEKLYYVPIDVTIFDTTGISETNLIAREAERRAELEKILPAAILKDYDNYHFPIEQYKRLRKYHLWGLVWFIERVLFKFEKWHILK